MVSQWYCMRVLMSYGTSHSMADDTKKVRMFLYVERQILSEMEKMNWHLNCSRDNDSYVHSFNFSFF